MKALLSVLVLCSAMSLPAMADETMPVSEQNANGQLSTEAICVGVPGASVCAGERRGYYRGGWRGGWRNDWRRYCYHYPYDYRCRGWNVQSEQPVTE